MANVRDRDAMLPIELLLEGEDHQHAVDDPGDLLHPAAAPGPYLRGDVVEDANAELMAAAGHTQVEFGIVDENHGVGAGALDPRDQLKVHPPEETEMKQGGDEA